VPRGHACVTTRGSEIVRQQWDTFLHQALTEGISYTVTVISCKLESRSSRSLETPQISFRSTLEWFIVGSNG